MSEFRENLKREFQDEDYRYAYDEEFANSRMATQIKVIRQQRNNMTQAELAKRADMMQSRISALEDINYSAWSISTLRRIARALGVRLVFKFESWGKLLKEAEAFSREVLEVDPFETDPAFAVTTAGEVPAQRLAKLSIDEPETKSVHALSTQRPAEAMGRIGQ